MPWTSRPQIGCSTRWNVLGVRHIVCGAAALNLLGLARFTEDLDLFIAPEAGNIDHLKQALQSVFDDPAIEEISASRG